jgi:hypothetical protein
LRKGGTACKQGKKEKKGFHNFLFLVILVFCSFGIVIYEYSQTQTTFIKQPPAAIFFSLPLFTISMVICGIF